MTRANDLPTSEPISAPAPANVVDFAAYAANRRAASTPAPAPEAQATAAEIAEEASAAAARTDTEMLIQAMRALAVARARLDRLSREAAECRRKLDSIKLG